jgi:hypothetical protein
MIFRKNKPASGSGSESHSMRGRDSEPGKKGANALARRFLVDDEPETIDLASPGKFPESGSETEPETRVGSDAIDEPAAADRLQLLSQDTETGKFYVHPGAPGHPVLLAGEPVSAATELRKGDRIRIGDAEFEFLGPVEKP